MNKRIAVETLTLGEISDLFRESFDIAYPKAKRSIEITMKKASRAKKSEFRWIKSYEEVRGANLNFYCQKVPGLDSPIVSIAMPYRTSNGLILVALDNSNGGIKIIGTTTGKRVWEKWVRVYTSHYCLRFAERIMKVQTPTFQIGCEGLMFSDTLGPVRLTENISDGIDEIEFQFKEGQAYGYRDKKSKITYFRTVYSNDMLKGDRLNFHQEWKVPLDQIYDLFKRS